MFWDNHGVTTPLLLTTILAILLAYSIDGISSSVSKNLRIKAATNVSPAPETSIVC
jgi:hypothetical protein